MSSFNSLKGNVFADDVLDLETQKDKKLSNLIRKGKASLYLLAQKKYKRLENLINKKREIEFQRRKENFDVEQQRRKENFDLEEKRIIENFDMEKKRRKEDIIFERDLKLAKFQEEMEMKVLNKKLSLNRFEEETLIKDNKSIISLKEESDAETIDELSDNINQKGGNFLRKELLFK